MRHKEFLPRLLERGVDVLNVELEDDEAAWAAAVCGAAFSAAAAPDAFGFDPRDVVIFDESERRTQALDLLDRLLEASEPLAVVYDAADLPAHVAPAFARAAWRQTRTGRLTAVVARKPFFHDATRGPSLVSRFGRGIPDHDNGFWARHVCAYAPGPDPRVATCVSVVDDERAVEVASEAPITSPGRFYFGE